MEALVDQFIEVCQWSGTREEAQARIEAANGSLETALALVFEDVPPVPPRTTASSPSVPTPAPDRPRRSLIEELDEEYTRDLVIRSAPRASPLKTIYCVQLAWPLTIFGIIDKLFGLLLSFIPSSPRLTENSETPHHVNRAYYENTVLPVLKSINCSETSANVLRGVAYNSALEKTKTSFGYLLVIVTSSIHETSTPQVIKNVLSTSLVKRKEVSVLFESAQSVEGLNIAAAYGATSLPFIALVSPSPKSAQSSVIVMARLLEYNGKLLDTEDERVQFDAEATRAIEDHEPKLISLRLDRERFDDDRKIREQQDDAYQRSLEKDRQRAEEAKKLKEEQQIEETKQKAWVAKVFKRASALAHAPQETAKARISLRLPDGKRLDLKVPADSPVSDVYDAAYAHLNPDKYTEEPEILSGIELENLDPQYGFTLVSTVTRSVLPSTDAMVKDIEAAWPSGVFMVDIE